jgi:hypothetical protein
MTAREKFSQSKRRAISAFLIGFALFSGAGTLRDKSHLPFLSVVSSIGGVLSFGSVIFMQLRRLRCPGCHASIPNVSGSLSTKTARYCPSCGADLDTM